MPENLPIKFLDIKDKKFINWFEKENSYLNHTKKYTYFYSKVFKIYNNFFFTKLNYKNYKDIGIANFKLVRVITSNIVLLDFLKRNKVRLDKKKISKIKNLSTEEYQKKFFFLIKKNNNKTLINKLKNKFFNLNNSTNYVFETKKGEDFLKEKRLAFKKFEYTYKSKNLSSKDSENFKYLISNYIKLFNEHNLPFDKSLYLEILKILKISLHLYEQNSEIRRDGITLYHGQSGSPLHRILALAWKKSGAKLISFAHGYTKYTASALQIERFLHDGLSISNFFYVSNLHEKKVHLKIFKKYNLLKKQKINILLYKNNYSEYDKYLNKEEKKKKKFEKIKILLVGYSASDDFYIDGPSYYPMKVLKFEYDLLKLLKKFSNIEVFYKIHPDRIKEAKNIFDNFCKKVVYEKFEKIYSNYDVILLPTPFSTILGLSLETKKKIILINTKEIKWFKEDLNKIKKKCFIVNASLKNANFMINNYYLEKTILKIIE